MVSCGNKSRLLSMLTVTTLFFLAEIITGYLTNSMALVADSFHMLSDILSIVIGYISVHYSGKKSKRNTYDWARAEILGAMANGVFLMSLVFTIVINAIQRLIVVEPITKPLLILVVGAVGLVINIFGLAIFGGHAHGHHDHGHGQHGHKHSHNDQKPAAANGCGGHTDGRDSKKTQRSAQMNMQAVFLHVLGDALGSVVVIISALIIYYVKDDWRYYVDPVMSLVTSVIILWTTIPLLRRASMILLQNPPQNVDIDAITESVLRIPEVISIHDLHVWQLSGNCVIATVHIKLWDDCNFTKIARELKKIFHEVDIHSTTIQPEYCSPSNSISSNTSSPVHRCNCDGDNDSQECSSTTDLRTPTESIYPDDECLLRCVSDSCSLRMCCDGIRRRNMTSKGRKGLDSIVNPNYTEDGEHQSFAILDEMNPDSTI